MNRIAVLMKWTDRNNRIIKNNLMDLSLDQKQLICKPWFVVFSFTVILNISYAAKHPEFLRFNGNGAIGMDLFLKIYEPNKHCLCSPFYSANILLITMSEQNQNKFIKFDGNVRRYKIRNLIAQFLFF